MFCFTKIILKKDQRLKMNQFLCFLDVNIIAYVYMAHGNCMLEILMQNKQQELEFFFNHWLFM